MSRDSRRISRLLRHTAGDRGLTMSADGWVAIADVLAELRMSSAALAVAVDENDKQRLQVDRDRIRACQGHSLEGMPVTREALENSWERVYPTDLLWHGTNRAVLPAIQREGLRPGRRTHVHLAASKDSPVGRRTAVEVLLGVDSGNLEVYLAPQRGVADAGGTCECDR